MRAPSGLKAVVSASLPSKLDTSSPESTSKTRTPFPSCQPAATREPSGLNDGPRAGATGSPSSASSSPVRTSNTRR